MHTLQSQYWITARGSAVLLGADTCVTAWRCHSAATATASLSAFYSKPMGHIQVFMYSGTDLTPHTQRISDPTMPTCHIGLCIRATTKNCNKECVCTEKRARTGVQHIRVILNTTPQQLLTGTLLGVRNENSDPGAADPQ